MNSPSNHINLKQADEPQSKILINCWLVLGFSGDAVIQTRNVVTSGVQATESQFQDAFAHWSS